MFGFSKVLQSARHPKLGRAFPPDVLEWIHLAIFAFAFQPFFLKLFNQDAQTLAIVFTLIGIVVF